MSGDRDCRRFIVVQVAGGAAGLQVPVGIVPIVATDAGRLRVTAGQLPEGVDKQRRLKGFCCVTGVALEILDLTLELMGWGSQTRPVRMAVDAL